MNCRYVDPDSGATHEEIIDDLSCELTRAVQRLDASRKENGELRRKVDAVNGENAAIRLYVALKMLRAWSLDSFNLGVVSVVRDWMDGGMKGPIPFPSSPFFADWASKNGLSNIDGSVGFLLKGELVKPRQKNRGLDDGPPNSIIRHE